MGDEIIGRADPELRQPTQFDLWKRFSVEHSVDKGPPTALAGSALADTRQ